jgi:hypothetical protein
MHGGEVKALGRSAARKLPVRPKNEVIFPDFAKVFSRLFVGTHDEPYMLIADHISKVFVSPDWRSLSAIQPCGDLLRRAAADG